MIYLMYMNREEIFEKLNSLKVDKSKLIITLDASLVVQGIIDSTDFISYLSEEEISSSLFVLDNNNYSMDDTVVIDGINFLSLEKCYEIKKKLNRKEDKKIIQKLDLELCLKDNRRYEKELYSEGITYIGGVDEVGRGPLIGPVVAACCVLPLDFHLEGLTDSKKLSEKKRNIFYDYITKNAIAYGVGIISPEVIDEVNIYEASRMAMLEAISEVRKQIKLEHVLVDAMPLNLDIGSTSIIKGDIKSISISAASVIAKVVRDNMMIELDKKYPEYGFASHKGYPTKEHIDAINKYGLIDGYRKTYGPVALILNKE